MTLCRREVNWWSLWFVAFEDTGTTRMYRPFCRGGIDHCSAFCVFGDRQVFMVEPQAGGLFLGVLDVEARSLIEDMKARGVDVVFVERHARVYNLPRRPLTIMSCSTMISYVLGLDRGYWTPYGLRQALLKKFGGIAV